MKLFACLMLWATWTASLWADAPRSSVEGHSGAALPHFETPGSLPAGPVQGTAAMRALLQTQRGALDALEARGQEAGAEEALVALKAVHELERLDLLAQEAERLGRPEEAALARQEALRLRTPKPVKERAFVPRAQPVAVPREEAR